VAVLMLGSPQYVEEQVKHCISVGSDTSCLAAGCEVPAVAPDKNLFLMDRLLYR
jgi:uroporphyrinogen-III decarboxylase